MSGGGHEHIRGILETSPGAIAVLIVFFLLVTLGFEKGLHHAQQSLRRRKKFGLLAAVNNLSSELMLLAVAALFLTALEPAITQICLPAGSPMKPWLANVNGCACCLAKTKGVTECFIEDRQCPADFKEQCNPEEAFFKARLRKAATLKRFAEHGNSSTAGTATNHTAAVAPPAGQGKRLLAAAAAAASPAALGGTTAATAGPEALVDGAHAVCSGEYLESYEECGHRPGWAPAVTGETLEQVHMLLFVMAVVHILVSVLVLLLSTLKLRLWQHMGGGAAEDHLAHAAALAAAAAASNSSAHTITAGLPASKLQAQPTAAAAVPASAAAAVAEPAAAAAAAAAPADGSADTHAADQASGLARQLSSAAVLVVDAGPAAAAAGGGGAALAAPNWRGRPLAMQGPLSYLRECAELALRQLLLPLHPTLTKQEYAVLRASFYLTHLRHAAHSPGDDSGTAKAATTAAESSHSTGASAAAAAAAAAGLAQGAGGLYAPYLLECVERDGSKTVGLGLPMWILVLCFVLLSGAIGWATWLFLILAGGLLLAINTSLLATARHMTRGGTVTAQQPGASRWQVLHNARLLLGCIKLMLFFLAFVISQSVYFAAFFGTESCFFSRTGFQKNPVPWYGIMVIDICLLLSLALFTLPLYTITSHTLRADNKLLQQIMQQQQQGGASAVSAHHNGDAWENEH